MQDLSRALPLAGASNFRDLGGYQGLNGQTLRWRRLFRSDHLAALTPADHAVLQALGASERAAQAYALPGVAYHPLTIEPTVIHRALALQQQGQQLTAQDAVGLMQETYRCFVHDNAPRFAQMFRLLLDNDSPIVFHCTAGKDRTGFAAALILLALGVPRATVMEDYLLTNGLYRRPEGLASLAPSEVLAVLWRVQEDFLDAALHRVDADFGGIDTYLVDVLGLDDAARKELAQRYLQTL